MAIAHIEFSFIKKIFRSDGLWKNHFQRQVIIQVFLVELASSQHYIQDLIGEFVLYQFFLSYVQ